MEKIYIGSVLRKEQNEVNGIFEKSAWVERPLVFSSLSLVEKYMQKHGFRKSNLKQKGVVSLYVRETEKIFTLEEGGKKEKRKVAYLVNIYEM